MLAKRLATSAASALGARPLLFAARPLAGAGLQLHQKRTIFEHHPIPELEKQYKESVAYVDGVPIVSNRPTVPENLHPDPGMNGGYVNPPFESRAKRDPYGTYWDQQGRRNFGEPVHEDDDLLGRFMLHDYDYAPPSFAAKGWAVFIGTILAIVGGVYTIMPDQKPFVEREFPFNGLEKELGGKFAVRARAEGETSA